jgi:hypothetical protein
VGIQMAGDVWSLKLHIRAKYLLIAIADLCSENGDGVLLDVPTVAHFAQMDESVVLKEIASLARRGILTIKSASISGNTLLLTFNPSKCPKLPRRDVTPREAVTAIDQNLYV